MRVVIDVYCEMKGMPGIGAEALKNADVKVHDETGEIQRMRFDLNDYQRLAQRTSKNHGQDQVLNGLMGINGEAGECIDVMKKHMFQGHELDKERLVEELGDVLWYIVEAAAGMGVDLGTIAERNIAKLRRRYPEGFEAERSIHREHGANISL